MPDNPQRQTTSQRQYAAARLFRLRRIAAIIGDKPEQITGARRPNPMLARKKRVIRTQKRRRR